MIKKNDEDKASYESEVDFSKSEAGPGDRSDPAAIRGRLIAIVSGKGGSGKTMIAAEMGRILTAGESKEPVPVTLIDADLGTGGLSYYLGIKQVRNIRNGLIELLLGEAHPDPFEVRRRLQRLAREATDVDSLFLPIGDFSLFGPRVDDRYPVSRQLATAFLPALQETIALLRRPDGVVIVDCRGGVDGEILAICEVVDHIIVVSEPDTTSFQASRHLVETLSRASLGYKVVGFILNKVFEDPTAVIRNGTAVFGAQSLGSIPFDFEATRAFLIGNIPSLRSTFAVHVRDALSRAYPADVLPPVRGVWRPADYNSLNLASPASSRAGTALGLTALILGNSLVLAVSLSQPSRAMVQAGIIALTLVGLMAGIEPARRLIGRLMESYLGSLRRISGESAGGDP